MCSLNRYSQPIFLNYIKMEKNKSLDSWKKYRWTKWAVDNNVIKQHGIDKVDFLQIILIWL